jgi:hypothetical protein
MLDQRLDGNNLKSLAVRLVIRKHHAEGRAFARRPLTGFTSAKDQRRAPNPGGKSQDDGQLEVLLKAKMGPGFLNE